MAKKKRVGVTMEPPTARTEEEADAAAAREWVSGQGKKFAENKTHTVDVNATQRQQNWEAKHRRVTFYASHELLAAIEIEMKQSGRTKTGVIVDALKGHLWKTD